MLNLTQIKMLMAIDLSTILKHKWALMLFNGYCNNVSEEETVINIKNSITHIPVICNNGNVRFTIEENNVGYLITNTGVFINDDVHIKVDGRTVTVVKNNNDLNLDEIVRAIKIRITPTEDHEPKFMENKKCLN